MSITRRKQNLTTAYLYFNEVIVTWKLWRDKCPCTVQSPNQIKSNKWKSQRNFQLICYSCTVAYDNLNNASTSYALSYKNIPSYLNKNHILSNSITQMHSPFSTIYLKLYTITATPLSHSTFTTIPHVSILIPVQIVIGTYRRPYLFLHL